MRVLCVHECMSAFAFVQVISWVRKWTQKRVLSACTLYHRSELTVTKYLDKVLDFFIEFSISNVFENLRKETQLVMLLYFLRT